MKTLSANLQAHLKQEVTTLTSLWKIVRTDGAAFYFTSHDTDITFEGETYLSQSGFSATAIANNNALSVDNLDVVGIFDDGGLKEVDLRAGKFDYASVYLSLVNYVSPTDGPIKMRRGYLGEVSVKDTGTFTAELRGLTQILTNTIGTRILPHCPVDIGSAKCGVDIVALTLASTIGSVTDRRKFTLAAATAADDYFSAGLLTFTSGANAGHKIEVFGWVLSTREITLYLPTPLDIQVGDGVMVYPGCDGLIATCKAKFDNVVNFRGFPQVPGQDFMYSLSK